MKVLAVTHAEAEEREKLQDDKPRQLTEVGRDEAEQVAIKIKSNFPELAALDAALTSPVPRCVETVERIAEYLGFKGQLEKAKELSEWGLSLGVLMETLRKNVSPTDQSTVLVGVHADLANALCDCCPLSAASYTMNFTGRPILAVLEYDGSVTSLRECLELRDGQWNDLIVAKRSPDGRIAIGTWPTPE